ncbi:hypothetical protein AAG570_013665 [Ranatra chinensis]|uniref:Uncharacterized protein n=1 Tax=Ranatra chinensis TaxID=642074 RepID=A0ABD0Z148_9HEMI
MASKRRNMFQKNKTQETTVGDTANSVFGIQSLWGVITTFFALTGNAYIFVTIKEGQIRCGTPEGTVGGVRAGMSPLLLVLALVLHPLGPAMCLLQICTERFNIDNNLLGRPYPPGLGQDVTRCIPRSRRSSEVFSTVEWSRRGEDKNEKEVGDQRRGYRSTCSQCSHLELDSSLELMDMSHIHRPHWITGQPVAKCPIKLRAIPRSDRVWPEMMAEVECACEGVRCTARGSHTCVTVYTQRTVLRRGGPSRELVAVDCVCAVQRATLIAVHTPSIVI